MLFSEFHKDHKVGKDLDLFVVFADSSQTYLRLTFRLSRTCKAYVCTKHIKTLLILWVPLSLGESCWNFINLFENLEVKYIKFC